MTNQKKKPEPAEQADKPTTLKDFLALADKLSPDDRRLLEGIGAVIPSGVDEQLSQDSRPKFGYRCGHCNQVAIYFAGTKWGDREEPPLNVPISRLGWWQPRKPLEAQQRMNRSRPLCPHCGGSLSFSSVGALIAKYVVRVSEFEATRDKLFSRTEVERQARERSTYQAQNPATYDGKPPAANYAEPHHPVSDYFTPEVKAQVQAYAQKHGLKEMLFKAGA